jgi:hypothetical protein
MGHDPPRRSSLNAKLSRLHAIGQLVAVRSPPPTTTAAPTPAIAASREWSISLIHTQVLIRAIPPPLFTVARK